MDNYNNKDIYKLYKSIFSNVYIKSLIYRFVGKSNNNNNNNNTNKIKYFKYNQIGLNYIINSKNYELLLDKLKMGIPFNDINFQPQTLNNNLTKFIINLKMDLKSSYKKSGVEINEILLKFYKVNNLNLLQQRLIRNQSSIDRLFVIYNPYELIESFIKSNCSILLKQLYQDHYSVKSIKINDFDLLSNQSVLSEDQISSLFENVLKGDDVEMLDFVYQTLKIKNKLKSINSYAGEMFNRNAIYWALNSTNRDQIIIYLLNQMNFNLKLIFYNYNDCNNFLKNILKLDFNLLKRIIIVNDINLKLLFNDSILFDSSLKYSFPISISKIPFKKLLDFIQVSIYISKFKNKNLNNTFNIIQINNIDYLNHLLEKIELILISTSINEIQLFENQSKFKDLIYNIHPVVSNNMNDSNISITSIFKPSKVQNNENSSNIFNFREREIKRIYLFDFLLPILLEEQNRKVDLINLKIKSQDIDVFTIATTPPKLIKIVALFLINFSTQFKEYNLILDFENYVIGKGYSIIPYCQRVATKNVDLNLLLFIIKNFKNSFGIKILKYQLSSSTETTTKKKNNNMVGAKKDDNDNGHFEIDEKNDIDYYLKEDNSKFENKHSFNNDITPIIKQIKYLSILIKYNINYPISISKVLELIFTNESNKLVLGDYKNNNYLNEIAILIQNYYNINNIIQPELEPIIFENNSNIGDYFYLNHYNLFKNWDDYLNSFH